MPCDRGQDAKRRRRASEAVRAPPLAAISFPPREDAWFARRSDAQLATLIGCVLFALAAWTIPFMDVAPYQDLPAHLATVTILTHPDKYPEYVFNGFFKTNGALIAFVYFVGKLTGIKLAARLFILGILAANAFVFPRFVLAFTDRARMIVASFFLLPMIHNWWVSMGMLNFSLAVALSLWVLMALDRSRAKPSLSGAALIATLSIATWYAHAVPLFFLFALVVVEVLVQPSWRARLKLAKLFAPPLAPAALLVLSFALLQTRGARAAPTNVMGDVEWSPPIWTLYDVWARWFYGFTILSASTIVPAVVLAAILVWRFHQAPRFFRPLAMAGMLLGCLLLPYTLPSFGYVNLRLVPLLWMGALLRVPTKAPRWLAFVLVASSALYAAGQSIDLFRNARDFNAFAAGMNDIPEGARLLTLNFGTRVTSKNTWSLHHASGLYVIDKLTSAQDVWADSPAMPIMHRTPLDAASDPAMIGRFISAMATRASFCESEKRTGMIAGEPADCETRWRAIWDERWRAWSERYDHVILWAAPPDVLDVMPAHFRLELESGLLRVYARRGAPAR